MDQDIIGATPSFIGVEFKIGRKRRDICKVGIFIKKFLDIWGNGHLMDEWIEMI